MTINVEPTPPIRNTSGTRPVRPETANGSPRVEAAQRMRSAVQHTIGGTEAFGRRHNAAPVMCGVALLHHDLGDDAILSHLAQTWGLDAIDCRAALDAAHILLRREEPRRRAATDT